MILKSISWTAAFALVLASGAVAQDSGISRTNLTRHDISSDPGHEAIQVRVDIEKGAQAPRHSHPGEEIVYVLKGTLIYRLDGQGPATLHKGDVLFIPAGVVHSVRNPGPGDASELATYLVEKGKPLLIPAK